MSGVASILRFLVVILFFINSTRSQIDQSNEIQVTAGEVAEISCKHSTANAFVAWYRFGTRESPIMLIGGYKTIEATERLHMTVDQTNKQSSLQIRATDVKDSAVYYCATPAGIYYTTTLRTGIGDKLVFGRGTNLNVLPSDKTHSSPSVFVLKTENERDYTTGCLAKDFYPKDVEMYMNSTSQNSGVIKASPVISNEGKYSAALVDKFEGKDVRCQAKHQNIWIKDDIFTPIQEDPVDKGETPADEDSNSCEEPTNEKANTLSMAVLGLRILFAKALAFNLLLTAKFFIC